MSKKGNLKLFSQSKLNMNFVRLQMYPVNGTIVWVIDTFIMLLSGIS